jgi:Zn-dependent protease with chaperone function
MKRHLVSIASIFIVYLGITLLFDIFVWRMVYGDEARSIIGHIVGALLFALAFYPIEYMIKRKAERKKNVRNNELS